MILTPERIAAYKELISNPSKHGLPITSINDFYEVSDTLASKYTLAKAYLVHVNNKIPKLILYIIMDEIYGESIDEKGILGYYLKVK